MASSTENMADDADVLNILQRVDIDESDYQFLDSSDKEYVPKADDLAI